MSPVPEPEALNVDSLGQVMAGITRLRIPDQAVQLLRRTFSHQVHKVGSLYHRDVLLYNSRL
jgi:hypothetical protein